jgi:SAM-dependent methyltransferase
MLRDAGHHQCDFAHLDVTAGDRVPGAPFDLVYARLLLYHLPQRVAVLRLLWDAVAPGGHLLVQDYDMRSCGVVPALDSIDEWHRVVTAAFTAAGCDMHAGARLPALFARAGIGTSPDGSSPSPTPRTHSPASSALCCRPRSRTASPASSKPPLGCLRSRTTPSASPTGPPCGRC